MKDTMKVLLIFLLVCVGHVFGQPSADEETVNLKCLIQVKNYNGPGVYIVASLINLQGKYVRTLYVQGQDYRWYPDLSEWWDNLGETDQTIDAVSCATNGSGARSSCTLKLKKDEFNAGYKIRFETAVKNQDYNKKDLEIALTNENIKKQLEGSGYIRYVRFVTP